MVPSYSLPMTRFIVSVRVEPSAASAFLMSAPSAAVTENDGIVALGLGRPDIDTSVLPALTTTIPTAPAACTLVTLTAGVQPPPSATIAILPDTAEVTLPQAVMSGPVDPPSLPSPLLPLSPSTLPLSPSTLTSDGASPASVPPSV